MAMHCERCGQENAEDARFCRHCGAPLASLTAPEADPLIGQLVLGRYEVNSLIGEGGMGRVYAASQRVGTTTRKVAVKTLRAQLGADPQLVKRFYREAETIVRLTHPNTIQFFDFGELPDRTLVIVMEFIQGVSLADALLSGPLPSDRFEAILSQICGALYEAHQLGIVHRDLKPDNILLTERGGRTDFVKVLDFGIAKISATDDDKPQATKLTQQGMMVGTPPYMSPEQFSGDAVDARSDIYSLGVIAYEMLTGRLPFDAKTPWEWASKHLTEEPAPLRVNAQTGISERRAWAIRRALSKSAADRQSDVQELLRELTMAGATAAGAQGPISNIRNSTRPATAAAPTPVHTPRAEPTEDAADATPGLPKRRGSMGAWAAALGVVVVLGFVIERYAESPAKPAALPPPPAPAPLATATVAPIAPAPTPEAAPLPTPAAAAAPAPTTEPAIAKAEPSPSAREHRKHTEARERASGPQDKPAPAPAPAPVAEPTRPVQPVASDPPPAPVKPAAPVETPKDLADRVKKGLSMAEDKPEVAVGMYQAAASKYGADHPALAPFKRSLSSRAPARIRELVGAGRCAQAQALYRAMRSAGLAPAPSGLFGRTCPAPA